MYRDGKDGAFVHVEGRSKNSNATAFHQPRDRPDVRVAHAAKARHAGVGRAA